MARTADYYFVGPDNGVLSWALAREPRVSVRRIENPRLLRHPVSWTFHGRDVFVPVAAHLASGTAWEQVGPMQSRYATLPGPALRRAAGAVHGEVVYVDRFGNAITNLPGTADSSISPGGGEIWRGRRRLCAVAATYGCVARGQSVAVAGSTGHIEIAVNGESASERLQLRAGDRIRWAAAKIRTRGAAPGLRSG